uniref:ARAD1B00902p n=1 Tax=Blastobotrys adeninivorans TaxID=409370 RepID=A0A060T477_BLAAD
MLHDIHDLKLHMSQLQLLDSQTGTARCMTGISVTALRATATKPVKTAGPGALLWLYYGNNYHGLSCIASSVAPLASFGHCRRALLATMPAVGPCGARTPHERHEIPTMQDPNLAQQVALGKIGAAKLILPRSRTQFGPQNRYVHGGGQERVSGNDARRTSCVRHVSWPNPYPSQSPARAAGPDGPKF